MAALADISQSFKSKTIFGLLRNAPDLLPHIKNIEDMFKSLEKGVGQSLTFIHVD
jgi:DNA mismatch repair protein MSH6